MEPCLPQHCLCREPAGADWCCLAAFTIPGSSGTGVILQLQPLPGLPEAVPSRLPVRQGQKQPWPAGLAPKLLLGWRASKRACVLRQLCQASSGAKQHPSVAQPHHSTGGFLQLWGRAAPWLRNPASSCSHLSRCQLEGLNIEPDVRQDRLCQLGRPALRGELHLCYPLFLLGAVQVSRMKKENSCA